MANRTPVVFIHGLWLHASSWGPWIELFRETGYEPMAPGRPGDPETVQEARGTEPSLASERMLSVRRLPGSVPPGRTPHRWEPVSWS